MIRKLGWRSVFSIALYLCLVGGSSAQEPLMDHKYTEPYCEYGKGSIDILLAELTKEPGKKGVIVLHPSMSDPIGPYKERVNIQNQLKFRRFDEKRVEILLGDPELKPSTELWRVAAGKPHGIGSRAWDLSIVDLNEPLLVHREVWIDGIGCGLFDFSHEFFADVLKRNDEIVGRVVVRASTVARFESQKRRILRELVGKYKVVQKHIEFAYLSDNYDDIEYWLFPSGYLEQL